MTEKPPSATKSPASQVFPPHGHCLWSDDRGAPYRFCGEAAAGPERAWCAEHRPRVYQALKLQPPRPPFDAAVKRVRR